jgi:hypothetical protein
MPDKKVRLELERERQTLLERLARVERELEIVVPSPKHAEEPKPAPSRARPRSLRESVLDQLHATGSMMYSQTIAQVFRAQSDREVASTRFGTLSYDEQKMFDTGRAKVVFLCHGLTYDRGEAIKRLWARSDWPLKDRIVGPNTGRVIFLKLAIWLNHAAGARPATWARRDLLEYLAADCARDLGLRVRKGDRHFSEWRAAAEEELARIEPDDADQRRRAAAILSDRLKPRELHFGAAEALVALPGSRGAWRRIE